MAYKQGDLILHDHYNTFTVGNVDGIADNTVANINTVWGTGYGNRGYGQPLIISPVTKDTIVTAEQWRPLITRLNTIRLHQSGYDAGVVLPSSGDIIKYMPSLSYGVTNAFTQRLAAFGTLSKLYTESYELDWASDTPVNYQQIRKVTFPSGDAARYFFNAGGILSLKLGLTGGGSATAKETAWKDLLTNGINILNFNSIESHRTGSAYNATIDNRAGYYNLTATDQVLIRLFDTKPGYTSNYVEILARTNGTRGTNGDTGSEITFTINCYDGTSDSYTNGINIIIQSVFSVEFPNTNLSKVWMPAILSTVRPPLSISRNASLINEGQTATFTVLSTTNNISLPYTITGITAADLSSGTMTGFVTINSTGSGTISFTLKADRLTEGIENIIFTIDGTGISSSIRINDTSLDSTYVITNNSSNVNEGGSVTFTLTTTEVDTGTIVPYTISGISAADLSSGSLSGSFVVGITNTATFTLAADLYTEGTETMTMTLTGKNITNTVTINDTSRSLIFLLSASVSSINEGDSVTFILTTVDVNAGTVVPYTISGITSADLSAGAMSGNFVVGITNTATFTLAADLLTEGTETITMTLTGKGISASCAIADTSKTPVPVTGSMALSGSGWWIVPQYVTSATFSISGGGGGGGGSDGGDKNHWLFGLGGQPSNLQTTTVAVVAGQTYSYILGRGGSAGGGQGAGGGGGTSTIKLGTSAILSAPGGAGGAPRVDHVFHPGIPSSNGGASGGNGSAAGYKNVPGSAGQAGFGTITWSGTRPG